MIEAACSRRDGARPMIVVPKRAMLTSVSAAILGLALAQPAFAQAAVSPNASQTPEANASAETEAASPQVAAGAGPTDAAAAPAGGAEIVVTGSRITRRDYNATSPIVTVDRQLFEQSSTAAVESNLNKLPEFTPTAKTPSAGGDIQPTARNTPGAATVSLRNIGENRNLVLIDGRRATPSNASMVVDINSLPAAAIERVEVITGGASSTYGADAVSGVVNFILRKNFQGLELDAQSGITEAGDGFEYSLSGLMGTNFDDGRGNITIALSTNRRKEAMQNGRSWYRDLWADPNVGGTQFFPPFGGYYTGFTNLPSAAALNSVIDGASFTSSPAGSTIYSDFSGNAFSGFDISGRPGASGFTGIDDYNFKQTAVGTLAANNTYSYAILPLERYNMYLRGNYELNDWLSVFAQGYFSSSKTHTVQEPSPITSGWTVLIDPTINRSVIPTELLTILDSRADPTAPFQLSGYLPFKRESFTDVTTYNMTAGLQGKIPGTDWTYEVFGQRGESRTSVLQTGFASLQRFEAIITQPNFGAGFTTTGNQGAPNYGFGASTATCTSGINLFNPSSISQDCLDAIKADIKTTSVMEQTIWEADFQGGLFALPAGEIRAAVGASYRSNDYQFLNDTLTTQGTSFLEQAIGLYPSGNSSGRIVAREAYGELLVPILKDLPAVSQLNLELGLRYSDYNTTGGSWTYKALGDWQMTNWLRLRGGYNRAERAPNIAELYLAPEQTFAYASGGDVCSVNNGQSYSANPAKNANYAQAIALCGQLMERSGNAAADDQYYGADYRALAAAGSEAAVRSLVTQAQATGGSYVFPSTAGNATLRPEKADTITAGAVISSPFEAPALRRLRLSVDYYQIKIKDLIAEQTVDIVQQQCFDPQFNPTYDVNSPYCAGVNRNQTGALGNVVRTFYNNGRLKTSGLDVQLDWSADIGPGTFNLNSVFNYVFEYKLAELSVLPYTDYTGTIGYYDYKLLTTLGYKLGPVYLGVQWRHLPKAKDTTYARDHATTIAGVGAYDLFALQGTFAVTRDTVLRFGVENLFNKAPPLTGVDTAATGTNLAGGSYNATYYDTVGRRYYIGMKVKL